MPAPTSIRFTFALLLSTMLLLALPRASAQEDPDDMPLGDVARSLRKNAAPSETVIDNDNFWQVIDDAESRREAGTSLVFSLDSGAKNFNVSSPDVTCSLSFTAKTASLLSDPAVLNELPRTELAKLDGPATIDGDSLQVSMHNGTSWELREVVIGLTIVRRPEPGDPVSYLGPAGVVPSVVGNASPPVQASFQKQPDTTVLLRMKGSAAPSSTATFRTPLNFALFPDQEWHWAIVKAKGIPPQAPPDATAMMQPANADQPAVARPDVNNNSVAPTQSTTNNVPATPDAFPH
ncbi:MAG: hypothetical protein WA254_01965 [Candidatus Sulfotelmatobacter sp.]